MASPRTSRLRFASLAGASLAAPPEWAPSRILVDVEGDDWKKTSLFCGDHELDIVLTKAGDEVTLVAEWPRSGAGRYSLRLEHPDGVETLEFRITPEKLTQEAFEALIDDLEQRLPATIAISLQRAGALTGLKLITPQETTLAEELNRLCRACVDTGTRPGLARVLRSVARQPHHILRSVDIWTRRERARRIDPTRLYQAFARRSNLNDELMPLQVPERRVEHTADVYENRLLRTFYDQVNARLRSLIAAAERMNNPAVRDQAAVLLADLSRARHDASFLDDVGELSEPPARVTMVLLRRSEYRAALDGFLEFRRSALVRLDEPRLAAPLTNLPELYEKWGTLEAIAALLDVAVALGYSVTSERLTSREPSGIWIRVLPGGPAVRLTHPSGRRVQLIPQRLYSRGTTGLHSISFSKRPDIAVEITEPDGSTRIWIFDPKYKLDSETRPSGDPEDESVPPGRPKRQDIDAMHAYRDAIRDGDQAHVVRHAAILYPGPTETFGDDIAALEGQPLKAQALARSIETVLTAALSPATASSPTERVTAP